MLVLSRKTNESVVVGSADGLRQLLTVTVLEIRHSSVRLGFEAGDDLPVHRSEVWARLAGHSRPLHSHLDVPQHPAPDLAASRK
jgi:carbon storage regulator CsrA